MGKYIQMLVEKGFKVATAEQTEDEFMKRCRQRENSVNVQNASVVQREICGIYTKGTFANNQFRIA